MDIEPNDRSTSTRDDSLPGHSSGNPKSLKRSRGLTLESFTEVHHEKRLKLKGGTSKANPPESLEEIGLHLRRRLYPTPKEFLNNSTIDGKSISIISKRPSKPQEVVKQHSKPLSKRGRTKDRSSLSGQNLIPLRDLRVSALLQLPSQKRALQLIENYFKTYSHSVKIVDWPDVMIEGLFSTIYGDDAISLSAYNISSFFSILALGSATDLPLEPACQEFRGFRNVAKALFFENLPKVPSTVDEIESLLLFYRVSWPLLETHHSNIYELMRWGIKLGKEIDLHRDPEILGFSLGECRRRRRVFWALWYYDTFASLSLGQPPAVAKESVNFDPPWSIHIYGAPPGVDIHPRLTLLFQDISSHVLQAKSTPQYATALLIDQKIRKFELDIHQAPSADLSSDPSQAHEPYISVIKCFMLISLHRIYFSYAATRPNEDPIFGRFGTSTHAVFEAASTHIERLLFSGGFTYWQYGLFQAWMQHHDAMLFLYAFPTYLPYWPQSEEAMKLADTALSTVFYPTSDKSELISQSLPSFLSAQQKAQESFAKYQKGYWTHPTLNQSSDKEASQDILFDDKFIIYNASSYDMSRGSPPTEHHNPLYLERTSNSPVYNWMGHSSMLVSSETYGHSSQDTPYIFSNQQSEGHSGDSVNDRRNPDNEQEDEEDGSGSGSGELSYAECRGSPSSLVGYGSDSNSHQGDSLHPTPAMYMARSSSQSSLDLIFASIERSVKSRQNIPRSASLSS